MPADLMRSFFPKICAYINTEKFFWCAFTVKNVCCTQYLDPIDELLTGKQYRLERLRRQKTKPERYLKQYHKGCNQQTLLYLAFLLCWLKKIYSSNISQVCRTNGPNNLFQWFHKQYFHYRDTLKARTEGACLTTVSNAEHGDFANM